VAESAEKGKKQHRIDHKMIDNKKPLILGILAHV
jgi:hypothetical protein